MAKRNGPASNSKTQEELAKAFSSGAMQSLDRPKCKGFWRPEEGDKIAGRLEHYVVWDDDGEERGMFHVRLAFPTKAVVFDEETEEYVDGTLDPEDIIGIDEKAGLRVLRDYVKPRALVQIEYLGKIEIKRGKTFHQYSVQAAGDPKPWTEAPKPKPEQESEDDIPF